MTDFSKTLIRCSGIGNIMTPPKLKESRESGNLSETCKNYLIDAYIATRYSRVREVETKQMRKGSIAEEASISLFSIVDGKLYAKNRDRIANEFITGIPDLCDTDDMLNCNEIIDIKTCWDIFTFLPNVLSPECKQYYWQVQGYMALTGAKIGTIAYCLVNTPDSIVEGEKYSLLRRMDVATEEAPEFQEELKVLIKNRNFDDIPMEERVLTYSIERNDEDIERIYQKVEKCREFMTYFEEKHYKFSKEYRKTLNFTLP